jgi:hypothetical protein
LQVLRSRLPRAAADLKQAISGFQSGAGVFCSVISFP